MNKDVILYIYYLFHVRQKVIVDFSLNTKILHWMNLMHSALWHEEG